MLINFIVKKILKSKLLKDPIDHLIIDNFLPKKLAKKLSLEFGDYNSSHWHCYSNKIEEKKTCNQWNLFNINTYTYFSSVLSNQVDKAISKKFRINVISDYGLHGGGQHIHGKLGNLNPHLDYSLHPKINLERRINVIYYLTDRYHSKDGGHLGFWDNKNSKQPGNLKKEYEPRFNRLILFNTSQNSWHGLSRLYNPAKNKYRKSLATYYLSIPRKNSLNHNRALYAPREKELNNRKILKIIKLRSSKKNYYKAYR
jgi:hypothetical protein